MVEVGQAAPDFELPNQDGEMLRLSDFRGRRVILFAFPAADTPGCNMQACGFRDAWPQVETAGAVVLGISGDREEKLREWRADWELPYDLLSDRDHQVLAEWGARRRLPLLNIGLPLTIRSHWVIDEEGVVVATHVGVGPGASVREALAAAEGEE